MNNLFNVLEQIIYHSVNTVNHSGKIMKQFKALFLPLALMLTF